MLVHRHVKRHSRLSSAEQIDIHVVLKQQKGYEQQENKQVDGTFLK